MTDSQKAATEIVAYVASQAYILESVDCTPADEAKIEEHVRKIIDRHLC